MLKHNLPHFLSCDTLYPVLNKKIIRYTKRQENTQEMEVSEPGSAITQMLEVADREFKMTLTNILRL